MIRPQPPRQEVLRPSPDALRGTLRDRLTPAGIALLGIGLGIKFLVVAKHLSPGDPSVIPLFIGVIGGVLVFAGIWHTFYLRNAALALRDWMVTYRGRFGWSRSIPVERIAGFALRSVRFPYTREPISMYVLVGRDKHALLTLPGMYWKVSDLEFLS